MAEKEVTLNPNDLLNLLTYYQDVQGKGSDFLKAKVKESRTKLLNQRIDKYKQSYGLTPDESKLTPKTNFRAYSFPDDMESMIDVLNYLEYANELAGNKPVDYTQLARLGSVLNLVKDAKYTPEELFKIYNKYMDNYKKFKSNLFSITNAPRNMVSSWLQGKEPSNLYEGDEYADYAKNITDLGGIPSKEQWLRDTVLKSNLPDNIQRYSNFQDNSEEVARAFKDIVNSAEPSTEEQVDTSTPTETVSNASKRDAYTIGMEALNKNKDRYVQLGWWD